MLAHNISTFLYLLANFILSRICGIGSFPTSAILPENIDIILDEVPSEIIFKHKLQIFEKEEVQNSENKKARAKIRKSTNLIDMLSAYSEIVNEGSKA